MNTSIPVETVMRAFALADRLKPKGDALDRQALGALITDPLRRSRYADHVWSEEDVEPRAPRR